MKKNAGLLVCTGALTLCCGVTGCFPVEVKTEHEVKPIHITLDVNLNVSKAMEQDFEESASAGNSTKESIRSRRKARRTEINELKARGIVGEFSNGLLVYRVRSNEKASLVKAENTDREQQFRLWADENKMTKEEIAAQYALRVPLYAKEGHYVMKNGLWHKMTASEVAENAKIRQEKRKK